MAEVALQRVSSQSLPLLDGGVPLLMHAQGLERDNGCDILERKMETLRVSCQKLPAKNSHTEKETSKSMSALTEQIPVKKPSPVAHKKLVLRKKEHASNMVKVDEIKSQREKLVQLQEKQVKNDQQEKQSAKYDEAFLFKPSVMEGLGIASGSQNQPYKVHSPVKRFLKQSDLKIETVIEPVESVVIRKGWIYKKGKYFFSQWHPKWAVLSQKIPVGIQFDQDNSGIQSPNSAVGNVNSSKKGVEPASLDLYDDRSHFEAKQLPKYSFTFDLLKNNTKRELFEVKEGPLDPNGKRHYFQLQSKIAKTGGRKIELSAQERVQFYSFSQKEQKGWIEWLNKVQDNSWWCNDKSPTSLIASPSLIESPTVPSAPLKNDTKNEVLYDAQKGASIFPKMTPVIPTALVIPQGDNDCVIGYQNITVLNLSDLQKKNKKPMFMSRDVKNQLLQRSWCESLLQFHESVGTGMSVLEDRFKKGYYKLLGEFRSLAIEVIIERVDSFHRESFSGFGVAAGEFLGPQLRLIFLSDILGESVELKTDLWWKVQYKGFSGVLFVEPLRGSTTGTFNSNPICRKPTCQVLQLVEKLDKLDIQPWESSLLGEYIHVHGYCLSAVLGEMLAMAKMPHTKELLVIEILARTFKSFLRGQLREAIEKYHKIKAVHIEGALKSLVVDNYNQFFANFNTKSVGGDGLDKWIERAIFKFGPALDKGILKNALENQVDLRRLLFIINLQTGIQLEESFLSNSKVGGNSANHSTVGISLQIDNSCLLTFEVKNFQGKDKGMCQLSLYPFLRQMQHKGLEGLGLLTAVKTTGTLDMLTHDLAMPIYTLQETSPIDRYFENILEFNEDFIGQLERDSTGSSRRDAELMLDRVDLVASIYFQVYGLTDRRAAIWLYLISLQLFYNNQVDSSNKTSHLEGLIKGALELTEEDDYILQSFIKTLQIQHDLISNTNDLSLQQDLLHARILEAHGQLACMLGQSHPLVARFFQVLSGTFWFIFHSQINGDVDSRESETGNQLRSCRLPHSVQFMCTEWQRRAVQVALRGLGKRHGFTLRAQLLFGCYALFEGLFEDAICAFLETLNQVENNPTPVSNSTATSRNGGLHLGTETLSTSTNSYEHELPITFKADLYFALCEAYSLKGDIERALSYGKLAKSCKESLLGHEHPQTIQSYYQLGLLAFSRLQQERITSTCSPGVTDDISGISGTLGFWITGKVMTKQFTGLANLALGCFEKIFHFIKYQSVGTTRILKNSPTSGSTTASRQSGVFTKHSLASLHNTEKFVALSPVQMAVYSPINIPSSHNTNGEVGASVPPVYISSTCSQEFISLQLFEVSKKLLLLSLLLLDPVQRDTLLSIYRQYHQQLISDSTTGEFADFLCSTQKTVVLKLVAYSPITYFQTLLSSTGNSNSNNSNTDWLAERELMAIFALLESSSSL